MAWAIWDDVHLDVGGISHLVDFACPARQAQKRNRASETWRVPVRPFAQTVLPIPHLREMLGSRGKQSRVVVSQRKAHTRCFLIRKGKVVVKQTMVRAIELFFAPRGEPCRDASGRRLFGGHSCRVAGMAHGKWCPERFEATPGKICGRSTRS